MTFEQLLDDIAERTAAPGGGTAAACVCALAAALVEMAARFADAPERSARAAELRAAGLQLAEHERRSFEPALDAMRLPREDPTREQRLQSALSAAAEPPLALARIALEVSQLGAQLVRSGNPNLKGDAVAGVLLAEAACLAATRLVELNLAAMPDDARLREARALGRQAARARIDALDAAG